MPERSVGLIVRLGVTGGTIIAALLCAQSAHDRGGPRWLGVLEASASERVRQATEAGDLDRALGAAEDLIADRPLEARSASILGAIQFERGAYLASDAAYLVAGALGWREEGAQLYLFSRALGEGAFEIAAQRLDALFRSGFDQELLAGLTQQLEASEGGRSALVSQLGKSPDWFLQEAVSLRNLKGTALRQRAETLSRVDGESVNCSFLSGSVGVLLSRNEADVALPLWRRLCGSASTGVEVANGDFEQHQAPSETPFRWDLQSRGGLSVSIEDAPAPFDGRALRVSSSSSVTQVAARQPLFLKPGSYRVSWRVSDDAARESTALFPSLQCTENGQPIALNPVGSQTGQIRVATARIPDDCSQQSLRIMIRSAMGARTLDGWIDDIAISNQSA